MERAAAAALTTTAATARAAARAAARTLSTAANGTLEAERENEDHENASTYLSVFEGIYEMQQRALHKKCPEPASLFSSFSFSPSCSAFPAANASSSLYTGTEPASSAAAVAVAPRQQLSSVDVQPCLTTHDVPAPAVIGTAYAPAADWGPRAAELGNSDFIENAAATREGAPPARHTAAGGEDGKDSAESVKLQDVSLTQQRLQEQQQKERACVGQQQEEEEQKRYSGTSQQYISKHVVVCALADLGRSGVRTPQAWQPVLLLVLQELPRFSARQLQQTATALQRGGCCCPLVLQGLTEAFYWRCEEKKSDVQDCVLLLDALRRLRYRPSLRHVNKIIERIRDGRRKLTVSLCLKLLRFFVETSIDATQLKHSSFYWGTLTHVERSIASLHPSEIVAFARLLPRLRIRDGQIYERLCLHLYNRSRDMINSNVRTAGCMQEALLLPPGASSSLHGTAAAEQGRRAAVSLAETSRRNERPTLDAAGQSRLSQQHISQEEQTLQQQNDPDRLEVITREAAFLPALLHLGRALVQAKLLALPTPFWLALKQHTEQHFHVLTPTQITFLLNLLSRYQYRDTSLLNKLGCSIERHASHYPPELLVSALNSLASLSYRHRTLHASLARHLLRSVLCSEFPRVEALVHRCSAALSRAAVAAPRSSAVASGNEQKSSSSCTDTEAASFGSPFECSSSQATSLEKTAGRAKPLPRDVHLPPPMFYDSPSDRDRRSRTARVPLFKSQQQEDSQAEHYQQLQQQIQGQVDRAMLPGTTARQDSDSPEVRDTPTSNCVLASHEQHSKQGTITSHAQGKTSAVNHVLSFETHYFPQALVQSSASYQDPHDMIRKNEPSRSSNSSSHGEIFPTDRGSVCGADRCSPCTPRNGILHDLLVVPSNSAMYVSQPPCIGEPPPMQRDLLEESEDTCVVCKPFRSPQQQDGIRVWKRREADTCEKNPFSISNSRHSVRKKLYCRTEARALQAAAQLLPGRVNPSVAAALLQACAAINHRNTVLLSCLMASLEVAMLREQEKFSITAVGFDAAFPIGRDAQKAAVPVAPSALTPTSLAGTRLYFREDPSHPIKQADDIQFRCCTDTDINTLSGLAACGSEGRHSDDACERSFPSYVSRQRQQAADEASTVSPAPPGDGGCLSPQALRMIMCGKNPIAQEAGNKQAFRRRSFVGLHEVHGLVFQSLQPPGLHTQDEGTLTTSKNSNTIGGPAAIQQDPAGTSRSRTDTSIVPSGRASKFAAIPSGNVSADFHYEFSSHTPPRNETVLLRCCRHVDGNERTANTVCTRSQEGRQAHTNRSHDAAASSCQPRDTKFRNTVPDVIDARQMHDLRLIAAQVARRTGRPDGEPSSAPAAFLAATPSSSCAPRLLERHASTSGDGLSSGTVSSSDFTHIALDNCQPSDAGRSAPVPAPAASLLSAVTVSSRPTGAASLGIRGDIHEMDKAAEKENACEQTQDHLEGQTLTGKMSCSSSGMMRFQYNARFFQKLRRAALLSRGRYPELEQLKNECLRTDTWNSRQQGRRTTGQNITTSKSGRIARVASLVPADSHVVRRVSAEEMRQRFWERLFKGTRHPQARRLLHRRLFRIACKLRGLDLLDSRAVQTWQATTAPRRIQQTLSAADEASIRQSEEGPHHRIVQSRVTDCRITCNYYRTAQVVRHTMKRWSALRRSFLAPYQKHARLIHKEMLYMQENAPHALAVLESTLAGHCLLTANGSGAVPARSAPAYLFMYFIPTPRKHVAAADHANLPFLVDTQLLLPPDVVTRRGHWLARSRLRCLYRRIVRDSGRSQGFVKERDARFPRPSVVVAQESRATQCNPLLAPDTDAELVLSTYGNEKQAHRVCSTSPTGKSVLLLSSSHSSLPPAAPAEEGSRKAAFTPERSFHEDETHCQIHGITEFFTPGGCTPAVARMTASARYEAQAVAIKARRSEERNTGSRKKISNNGEVESFVHKCESTRSLTHTLTSKQTAREDTSESCPVLSRKRVPLLQEASTALQAAVKLQFFPAGLLHFFVSHIYWAVMLLAKGTVKARPSGNSTATDAECSTYTSEAGIVVASTRLPSAEQHSGNPRRTRSPGSDPYVEAIGSTRNDPNVGLSSCLVDSCAGQKSSVLRGFVAPPHSSYVVPLQLLYVLQSVNAAAAAVLAATAAGIRQAKSACAVAPLTAALLTRERAEETTHQTEAMRARVASPAGTPSPTMALKQPQRSGPETPACCQPAARRGLSNEKAQQQRNGSSARAGLSSGEIGALCSMMEACYRSIAFRPLLTSQRKEINTPAGEPDKNTTIMLESVNLYTALLRNLFREESDIMPACVRSAREVRNTFSSTSPITAMEGASSQKLTSQEAVSHIRETANGKEDAGQLPFPGRAYRPSQCWEVHPALHNTTERELEIPRRAFCAMMTRFLADVVGIRPPFSHDYPVACKDKVGLQGSPPDHQERSAPQFAHRQHASNNSHRVSLGDERVQRSTPVSPACCVDAPTQLKEGDEARVLVRERAPPVSGVREVGETDRHVFVTDHANSHDNFTKTGGFLPAKRMAASAAARQVLASGDCDSTSEHANKLPLGSSSAGDSELRRKAYMKCLGEAATGDRYNGCVRFPRYPLIAVGSKPVLQLSTERMSKLLRTVLTLDELLSENDTATAALLKALRKVLNQRLRRIVCCEANRLGRDNSASCPLVSDFMDTYAHASITTGEANFSSVNIGAKGEFKRVLLAALVALTLDDVSSESGSLRKMNEALEGKYNALPGAGSFDGSAEAPRYQSNTNRISSSYSTGHEEGLGQILTSGAERGVCLLDCVLSRFSSMTGVPRILLRKLVQQELVRETQKIEVPAPSDSARQDAPLETRMNSWGW